MGIACSNGAMEQNNPTLPSDEVAQIIESDDGAQLFGAWHCSIDPETKEVTISESREMANFNFTDYLPMCPGGCFEIHLLWADESMIYLKCRLTNPIALMPYDVRIIFTNLDEKTMLEPDGYTNLFDPPGGEIINPFYYFYEPGDPERRFPAGPGHLIYRDIDVAYESFTSWDFDIIAVCGLGQHIKDVVEMTSLTTTGHLDSTGGSMLVEVELLDWQDDIAQVALYAAPLEGSTINLAFNPVSEKWECDLYNSMGAEGGVYNLLLSAYSPNVNNAFYCNYLPIEVGHQPGVEQFSYTDTNFFNTVAWTDFEGPLYQYKTDVISSNTYITGDKTHVYSSSLNYSFGHVNYIHEIGGESSIIWILGEFGGACDNGETAVYEWNNQVWVAQNYGTFPTRLYSPSIEFSPCICADGSRIAYISYDNGEADLAYRDMSDINTEIFPDPSNGFGELDPVMTANGDVVYLVKRVDVYTYNVYRYTISTNLWKQISDTVLLEEKDIQTSADGSSIVFLRESAVDSYRYNVWVYRENQTPHFVQITNDAGGDICYYYPDINADGTMILFNRTDFSTMLCDYYLANADGTNQQLIQNHTVSYPMSFNAY